VAVRGSIIRIRSASILRHVTARRKSERLAQNDLAHSCPHLAAQLCRASSCHNCGLTSGLSLCHDPWHRVRRSDIGPGYQCRTPWRRTEWKWEKAMTVNADVLRQLSTGAVKRGCQNCGK
jgi:hypothetical protein